MKSTALVTAAIVGLAMAGTRETPREAYMRRMARRAAAKKTSLPLAINFSSMDDHVSLTKGKNDVEYDSNWSGAIVSDSGVSAVSAYVTVPSVGVPSGGDDSTTYGGSAWVGIDGASSGCGNILQTGIDWTVQGGSVQYDAWYEWLPAYSTDFDITINQGDSIYMAVQASASSGATSGSATVNDQTNGQGQTQQFTGQPALQCQSTAEWIVEDFESGSSLIPFASYSGVSFTSAQYNSNAGNGLGVGNAQICDIQQNGQTLSSCSTNGNNEVDCSYTG